LCFADGGALLALNEGVVMEVELSGEIEFMKKVEKARQERRASVVVARREPA